MIDKETVQEVLDAKVRPALQADGGDLELVDVTDDGEVQVRLQGHCKGCPMAQFTLTMHVEKTLKDQLPEVAAVVPVE